LLSLLLRFRRARGDERQQVKWLAALTGGSIGLLFGQALLGAAGLLPAWATGVVGNLIWSGIGSSVPMAVGIAILRHRLYDIDRIVNRALVYGALTATLALVYWGSVVALQRAVGWLTGQEESALAVVASTLAIAALFQPLRHRIQAFIDRRFYRRKYDAARVVAAFSATLRDETDLDRLGADLVTVVEETMQPAHVSLWLRPAEHRASQTATSRSAE
jgi:hypothetical protein